MKFGDDDYLTNIMEFITKFEDHEDVISELLSYDGIKEDIERKNPKYYLSIFPNNAAVINNSEEPQVSESTHPQSEEENATTGSTEEDKHKDPQPKNKPIRLFISYTHDNDSYKAEVLALAQRLRMGGIDARLDQFETNPKEGWPRWMNKQIDEADFVLICSSKNYQTRAEGLEKPNVGLGATWEGLAITQEIYESQSNNEKFIPVILNPENSAFVPRFLRPYTRYRLYEDKDYELLYRYITGQPEIVPEAIGSVKTMGPLGIGITDPKTQNRTYISQNTDQIENDLTLTIADQDGVPINHASALILYNNGTSLESITNGAGKAVFDAPLARKCKILISHTNAKALIIPIDMPRGHISSNIVLNDGHGSIIIKGTGYVTNLQGRISLTSNAQGGLFIYGQNISFNDSPYQPYQLKLKMPFIAEDVHGNKFELTIDDMVGNTGIVTYKIVDP